jgi:hypothetical protein
MNEWNQHALLFLRLSLTCVEVFLISLNMLRAICYHCLFNGPPSSVGQFMLLKCPIARLTGSYTSPYWRSGISSTSVRNSVFSRVERSTNEQFIDGIISFAHAPVNMTDFSIGSINCVRHFPQTISLTSERNPRSSIRTSASTCFFRFNLKTKHVDFIHSFACQCHVYYTKYYNATCKAVNKHKLERVLKI